MSDDLPISGDSLDQLREQYSELAALAGSLAHEIKNPLSVIRMNMDLLAEDFASPQTPREPRAWPKSRWSAANARAWKTCSTTFCGSTRSASSTSTSAASTNKSN